MTFVQPVIFFLYKHLLSLYCVPGIMQGSGDQLANKTGTVFALMDLTVVGEVEKAGFEVGMEQRVNK